jgi:hypothetical protein
MKEAISSPYAKLVFREGFSDEQSVRLNGGTPTNLSFINGFAKFDASIVKHIRYNAIFRGTYSIRVKIKGLAYNSSNTYLIDAIGATFSLRMSSAGTVLASSGTVYVNGVATTTVIAGDNEIVVSGITMAPDTLVFGTFRNLSSTTSNIIGDVELFEIYQGALTASEVKNLYDGDWNKELISSNLILDYDSTNGYITDKTGKNTLTPTAVAINKSGSYYTSTFNGLNAGSKIDTGSALGGTGDITVICWNKLRGMGQGTTVSSSHILDNLKLVLLINTTNFYYKFTSNYSVTANSANGSVKYGVDTFIAITRLASGVSNIYIGDKNTAPVSSGNINQSSGTPADGTSNLTIGNSASQNRTVDGNVPIVKIYNGILSLEDLTQVWSSTRGKI